MYQCQMGKQTMGTPSTNFQYRADNKMYRLTYGQQPVVRTDAHRRYDMDAFPNGLNAIVAVIAYTGYDMEDAMIINKGSYDRGIAWANVYYSMRYDLKADGLESGFEAHDLYFIKGGEPNEDWAHIDEDGLPQVGSKLEHGDVLAVFYNS